MSYIIKDKPGAFIFIGMSGCGKGTQAQNLIQELKKTDSAREVFYLQTGAEFRAFIQGNSLTQTLSREVYDLGGLQPEFLAIYMWSGKLAREFKENCHLVIDGTPRKFHEAGVLHSIFSFYSISKPSVIHIKVSPKWATEKLKGRGRFDDNEEEIVKRLKWFETDVKPAIEFYRNNNEYNFIEVDGEQPIEKVWSDIAGVIFKNTQ